MAIQADDKIVAAGETAIGDFVLARYSPNGSLDPTFDGDGKVVTDLVGNSFAFDVAIQADGRIVGAGGSDAGPKPLNLALARYNLDGSLDSTFDGDGRVVTVFGGSEVAAAVAIQANGKIVAGATWAGGANPNNFLLARYNPSALDPTFDGDARVVTDFGGYELAADVAIQADGRIVAAGGSDAGAGPFPNDFALARYKADGSLDGTFHGEGRVLTDFGRSEVAAAVAIQANGRIVAAGFTEAGPNPANFALARYLPSVACFGVPATIVGTPGNDNLTGTAVTT